MKLKYAWLVAVLSAFCFAVQAAPNSQLSKQDQTWMQKAHQVNLAEIKMGTMAKSKGLSDDVRLVGDILMADHSMLDGQLKSTAQGLGVSLPTSPTEKQQSEAKMLAGKSGSEFDRTWTKKMIVGHKKAIAKTRKETEQGSSAKVKTLAESTLPVLQKHLLLLEGVKSDTSAASTQ